MASLQAQGSGSGAGGEMAGERRALDSQKSIIEEQSEEPAKTSMEQILMAVAASVMHSASGMSKWGIGDITLGLYKLYSRQSVEKAVDTVIGVPVVDKNELDDMLEWLGWATAAYEDEKASLASTMKVPEEDVVKLVGTANVMQPAYHIVIHRQRQCVVMSIRGTFTARDVLTDLNPHSESFEGGLAHSGMLAAARWLLQNEVQTLNDVLQANPGFALVLVGHSLGAGTAALFSLLLRETESTPSGPSSNVLKVPPDMITCWGFGCPPCVDLKLANSASFIKNVVLQDDVVARVSPAALEDLRSEMEETTWSQTFKDGTKGRMVVEMLQATAERFQEKEASTETTIVFEKTKDVGYSALLNAGNTIISRMKRTTPPDIAEPKKPNPWLTVGAAAASSFFAAASDRVKEGVNESLSSLEKNVEETDEGIAASAIAVNAATRTSKSKQDILMKNRLYVPGLLFHITRTPLKAVQKQAAKNQADQTQGVNSQADQKQGVKNQEEHGLWTFRSFFPVFSKNQEQQNQGVDSQVDQKQGVKDQEEQSQGVDSQVDQKQGVKNQEEQNQGVDSQEEHGLRTFRSFFPVTGVFSKNQADQNQGVDSQVDQKQGVKNQEEQKQGVKDQEEQKQGVKDQEEQNQGGNNPADPKLAVLNQEGHEKTEPPKFRYKVVKGTNSNNSRFSRIILSSTMLSDHSTPSYLGALVDALQHASESTASSE